MNIGARVVAHSPKIPAEISLEKKLWERACSRRRWISQLIRRLIQRFREQARSHRVWRELIRPVWLRREPPAPVPSRPLSRPLR
ncbi:hypothetical protein E5170_25700 [Pseudomonas atacamensis]|uniref:Uncharacterized protein n=1 Tax=Pseudomonas atacamensis TaxID=2565368 RepID=A0AAQ2D7N1_9PSED|nr:hypothetical protein E5170_25700 [Pseudomonas atacamensis]